MHRRARATVPGMTKGAPLSFQLPGLQNQGRGNDPQCEHVDDPQHDGAGSDPEQHRRSEELGQVAVQRHRQRRVLALHKHNHTRRQSPVTQRCAG